MTKKGNYCELGKWRIFWPNSNKFSHLEKDFKLKHMLLIISDGVLLNNEMVFTCLPISTKNTHHDFSTKITEENSGVEKDSFVIGCFVFSYPEIVFNKDKFVGTIKDKLLQEDIINSVKDYLNI